MSCQIVEQCQAKGYCPASIPPPRRRKLRILCFRLEGGKRSRSAAPPLPGEPADAGLPRGPESRATSLYTREALVRPVRKCVPFPLTGLVSVPQGHFLRAHPKGTSCGRTPRALPVGAPQGHFLRAHPKQSFEKRPYSISSPKSSSSSSSSDSPFCSQ